VGKLVVLKFGEGSFEQGFSVTLQIGEEHARPTIETIGTLPPDPTIPQAYHAWQSIYRSLKLPSRPIGLPKPSNATPTLEDCCQAAQHLRDRFNAWLQTDSFRPIREKWLEKLAPTDEVRLLIQTQDYRLQKLPWHLWELVERYPKAEIALSTPTYEQVPRSSASQQGVKILAILGSSEGIDIQADCAVLKQLPQAEVKLLVEPACKDLTDQLWQQPWDVLFFAGHSTSQETGETGRIYLNPTESLTISQLKYALRKSVERGLKLAIFNSCDGLGLAREFADLHIPQLIVMREPVPDVVAQTFLKYFLEAFARGESLYLSVREARERLQGLEGQFPCATWLPVICQNPAEDSPTWQEWLGQSHSTVLPQRDSDKKVQSDAASSPSANQDVLRGKRRLILLPLVSLGITALILGGRYLGMLQDWELRSLDTLMQLRPAEPPDSRLLVVTVTEDDVRAQPPEQRRGSLSDQALAKVLQKLETDQPRVIGLDIYRDYPVGKNMPMLAQQMRQSDRLIAVCQVSDPDAKSPGIPPPPEVTDDRLGFSDLVVDSDHIVRRHLLGMTPSPASPCPAPYAFSVQLALRYLAAQGITLEFAPDGAWQLGKTHFHPLNAHTGGYQGIDAWGHQIFLNYRAYRSLEAAIPQVTLGQVLAGQLNAEAVKDRVVLIGTTAPSFRDVSSTPYQANGEIQQVPGVILQAQMVSQLLSAVLDGRSLLWTWALWQEGLWVLAWALLGSGLGLIRRLPILGLASLGAIVSLSVICLGLLISLGCWVPLIPAALAIVGSSSSIALYTRSTQRATSREPRRKLL
jgi:CHASE2 domain-containing sensor protein